MLYRHQSPLVLQLSLGIICVFCVLAHALLLKNYFAFHFKEKLHQISANETKLLIDIVREDKTCIPISIMETNNHLHYKCHWEWLVYFVFSHMFCLLKTVLPFVLRKNFIKSVLMKISCLMIVCGKRKYASLFTLWIPITTCITSAIENHLCILCSRTCSIF